MFWWLASIGPTYAFAIGFMIGLVLILGSIMVALSNGAIADVLIFPFAVFSLIIGGGFIAGMLLGVIGGIYGALKK
jgi:ABC-type polysaccharide/polyol phosphate export permease